MVLFVNDERFGRSICVGLFAVFTLSCVFFWLIFFQIIICYSGVIILVLDVFKIFN
jgi:hypothetical protein